MSYTLNAPSELVRHAEAYAGQKGVTLNQLICDYLVAVVREVPRRSSFRIGSMRDELQLPPTFDGAFDALDAEVSASLVKV